ncbi:MAG: ATP-binding protein [Acidimicrobiales bacterium]
MNDHDPTTGPAFGAATIDDCEREQIHIPGSVQPHAALVVVRDGAVVQRSTNLEAVLGGTADASTLTDLVGADVASLVESLARSGDRKRQHRRVTAPSGDELDVSCTATDDGRLLVELEPVAGAREPARDFQDLVTEALTRINTATTSAAVVEEVVAFVQELTGFDRVMGYRFARDDHGEVVAERRRDDLEPFLGLHYPASDIPAQARRLYLEHWLRLIPDAAYTPVPVEPTLDPDTGAPLDMSSVAVRSVSPIHCEYLANMGVRASMSISLVVEGRLWGLVACHHYDGPHRPSVAVREACEFVALAASVMLGARRSEERTARDGEVQRIQRLLAEKLLLHTDLVDGLTADPDALLGLLDASGAAVVVGGRVQTVGATPTDDELRALCESLADADLEAGEPVVTDCLAELVPSWNAPDTAAGVVALPLSSLQRNYVVWVRPESRREVRWAGEPAKAIVKTDDGGTRLAPRGSFAEWVETVGGRSRPWDDAAPRILAETKNMIATHLTRSAEQLAQLNAELVRSNAELDAFAYVAAHDLKEPLRGLANYATFLAEDYGDVLDDDGRMQLDLMLKLSERMTGLLTSLLDYARIGRSDLQRTDTTLGALLDDTRSFLGGRLADTGGELVLENDGPLDADPELLIHVLLNLISNGLKYNDSDTPVVRVGLTVPSATERGATLLRPSVIDEHEPPVVYVRDNGIGVPADRIEEVFRVFRRLHNEQAYGGGTGAGLTIARRVVERHGGVIWLESTEGEGSTFYFTIGSRP